VLCELELERRHVPAPVPDQKLAAAEPMLGKAAERASRLRPNDAVDGEVRALL
jgi:hypothetical protein